MVRSSLFSISGNTLGRDTDLRFDYDSVTSQQKYLSFVGLIWRTRSRLFPAIIWALMRTSGTMMNLSKDQKCSLFLFVWEEWRPMYVKIQQIYIHIYVSLCSIWHTKVSLGHSHIRRSLFLFSFLFGRNGDLCRSKYNRDIYIYIYMSLYSIWHTKDSLGRF